VVVAKEFCRLLESEAPIQRRELMEQLLEAVLALYSAGLRLPEVDPELDTRAKPFFDQHALQMLREQLAERLGGEVADPEGHDLASLACDLAELYVAVKEGLLSIPEHAGRVLAHMIWNCPTQSSQKIRYSSTFFQLKRRCSPVRNARS
jgi:hypothetical protein